MLHLMRYQNFVKLAIFAELIQVQFDLKINRNLGLSLNDKNQNKFRHNTVQCRLRMKKFHLNLSNRS